MLHSKMLYFIKQQKNPISASTKIRLHTKVLVAGLEPARSCPRGILSPLRLPIPPHQRTHCVILYCMDLRAKHCSIELINANGWRWIRTTEANCSRFTVCPLWPLGNPSIFFLFDGTNRARTYDPLLVRQMLSQLS